MLPLLPALRLAILLLVIAPSTATPPLIPRAPQNVPTATRTRATWDTWDRTSTSTSTSLTLTTASSPSTTNPPSSTDATSLAAFDPRLPAGGIQMLIPSPISGQQYYAVGHTLSFVFNYTSVSSMPSAVDILATCTQNQALYTLAVNQTVGSSGTLYGADNGGSGSNGPQQQSRNNATATSSTTSTTPTSSETGTSSANDGQWHGNRLAARTAAPQNSTSSNSTVQKPPPTGLRETVLWDTNAYAATATIGLPNALYTLIVYDASKPRDALPSSGFLSTSQQFVFGLYNPQAYSNMSWSMAGCMTCSGAGRVVGDTWGIVGMGVSVGAVVVGVGWL